MWALPFILLARGGGKGKGSSGSHGNLQGVPSTGLNGRDTPPSKSKETRRSQPEVRREKADAQTQTSDDLAGKNMGEVPSGTRRNTARSDSSPTPSRSTRILGEIISSVSGWFS